MLLFIIALLLKKFALLSFFRRSAAIGSQRTLQVRKILSGGLVGETETTLMEGEVKYKSCQAFYKHGQAVRVMWLLTNSLY